MASYAGKGGVVIMPGARAKPAAPLGSRQQCVDIVGPPSRALAITDRSGHAPL